jgi:hypothetical protein
MSQDYGSATIAAVNNKRDTLPFQEPIGATVNSAGGANIVTLANGTVGGGFNAADVPLQSQPSSHGQFALGTVGRTDAGKAALYVLADVDVTAGAAAVTVAGNHITLATGGTYTCPFGVKAGQYVWVFLT